MVSRLMSTIRIERSIDDVFGVLTDVEKRPAPGSRAA